MCIALGHLNRGMAHPLHGGSDVYTCAQKSSATGVSQHVYDELVVMPQPYSLAHIYPITIEPTLCHIPKDTLTDCATGSIASQYDLLDPRSHLNAARLVRLGLPDRDATCLDIAVIKLEPECLALTQSRINIETEQI